MSLVSTRISVNGKVVDAPAIEVDGAVISVAGRFPRIASIKDEGFTEASVRHDPSRLVAAVAASRLRADIVTFAQDIDDPIPRHPYFSEPENVAAAPTTTFAHWWDRLPQSTRKNVRRAERRGVITRAVSLDLVLAQGIKGIYDETPIRQGRRFWHYGKDVHLVLEENGSYLNRSDFVASYVGDELIGFLKIVYAGRIARIMQLLSLAAHSDKRPMNALIAKAVELCSAKGMSYLVYSKFQYGNKTNTPLMEFKTRNGFERLVFPRYFVPLTVGGRFALTCRLHRGAIGILPASAIEIALRLRESLLRSSVKHEKHQPADRREEAATADD